MSSTSGPGVARVAVPAGGGAASAARQDVAATPATPAVDRAEAVRLAALACAGVLDLPAGRFGEVATIGPGRRVPGVRLDRTGTGPVEVHLTVRYGVPVRDVADRVRTAVRALIEPASAQPVDVHVADVADEPAAAGHHHTIVTA